MAAATPAPDSPTPLMDGAQAGSAACPQLRELLEQPKALEDRIRQYIGEVASSGSDGARTLAFGDMDRLTMRLAVDLGVDPRIFGEMGQMFWRFDFRGDGLLSEEEACKLCLCMLRQYRDATGRPEAGAVRLGGKIKRRTVGDKFQIEKKLGEGGQGAVFLAVDKKAKQEVVIKMYDKSSPNAPVEDITREFEMLKSMKHPRIANVFDIFQDDVNIYIVQEPYFGGDLTTAVQSAARSGIRMSEQWLARILRQVLEGVAFLHNKGVMHCDLKEPNVMVAGKPDKAHWQEPQVVVIDFGLANKFATKSYPGGTPGYMPPEVWERGLWTPRGDVFSLGVMIFSMRTGHQPFVPHGCQSIEQVREKTVSDDPSMALGSPAVQELVARMMTKAFQRRPSIADVMEDPWFSQGSDDTHELNKDVLDALSRRRERRDLRAALLADLASNQNLAQMRELQELFLQLDVDNDGVVSAADVRSGLAKVWPEDRIERLIRSLVGSDEGEVSYEEFMGQLIAATVPAENELLFRVFSEAAGSKGYLDISDITELLKRPAVQKVLGDREPAALLRELDRDGNGTISFDEFRGAMQLGPGRTRTEMVPPRNGDFEPGDMAARLSRIFPGFAGMRERPYRLGEDVEYRSVTQDGWIPCRIVAVDVPTGAIQIDVKPGWWLRGVELQSRIRRPRSGIMDRLLANLNPGSWISAPCCSTRRRGI